MGNSSRRPDRRLRQQSTYDMSQRHETVDEVEHHIHTMAPTTLLTEIEEENIQKCISKSNTFVKLTIKWDRLAERRFVNEDKQTACFVYTGEVSHDNTLRYTYYKKTEIFQSEGIDDTAFKTTIGMEYEFASL